MKLYLGAFNDEGVAIPEVRIPTEIFPSNVSHEIISFEIPDKRTDILSVLSKCRDAQYGIAFWLMRHNGRMTQGSARVDIYGISKNFTTNVSLAITQSEDLQPLTGLIKQLAEEFTNALPS